MSLVAAAVCPHPPVLIPEIAAGAAGELDDLRLACDAAIRGLTSAGAETVVIVGGGDRTRWLSREAYASFVPFGVSIEFPLVPGVAVGSGAGRLPLSLAVGAWLLARHAHGLRVEAVSVAALPDDLSGHAEVAARLRARTDPVALLVMGDGSACRGEKAPGYDDPRARPYDDRVARALAGVDVVALAGLDPVLSAELLVAGWAPWQVLAGSVGGPEPAMGRGAWRGCLRYYAAPYGVAYFVASWERAS